MQIKIPTFLSKLFNSSNTKEDKDNLVRKLVDYRNNNLTKELVAYLEQEIEKEILEIESFSFISLFQSKYKAAHSRGKREAYRKLLKQLRSDDV